MGYSHDLTLKTIFNYKRNNRDDGHHPKISNLESPLMDTLKLCASYFNAIHGTHNYLCGLNTTLQPKINHEETITQVQIMAHAIKSLVGTLQKCLCHKKINKKPVTFSRLRDKSNISKCNTQTLIGSWIKDISYRKYSRDK